MNYPFVLLIGNTSLNISFFLYLILYVPQIIHNRDSVNIVNLSLTMHFLLYVTNFLDLFYGFAMHLPWQYKVVSAVSLLLVMIQHFQLTTFLLKNKKLFFLNLNSFIFAITVIGIYYFFIKWHAIISDQSCLLIGVISRTTYLIYIFPQILKNKFSKTANAISLKFIYLNFILATLDMISAWCLDWGWPNKLAAPVMMIMMAVMLIQHKQYHYVIAK